MSNPLEWPYPRCPGLKQSRRLVSWDRFFHFTDKLFGFLQRHRITPLRKMAVQSAAALDDGSFCRQRRPGGDFPADDLEHRGASIAGFSRDSAEMKYCREQLWSLVIDGGETAHLQPCKSPVWDTALTMLPCPTAVWMIRIRRWSAARNGSWLKKFAPAAIGRTMSTRRRGAGASSSPTGFIPIWTIPRWCRWPCRETCRTTQRKSNTLPPNLRLITETTAPNLHDARRQALVLDDIAAATERARHWMLSMQNRDGGWAAFDRDNTAEFLCHVPFADHNAMIDPSSPDLAAPGMESLASLGKHIGDPAIDRGVQYLRRTQEADGSWFGRWGVNYIYGTWQALSGLAAVGIAKTDPMMVAGANWLVSHQQPSGGWGESADSYADPKLRGQGRETASQTAWALLG